MLLQHIIHTIESAAPLKWQEAWDNSGLQVGDRNAEVEAALLTTDVTESVVEEAIELHCDLIVSHHPLLFHGLKTISGGTPQERIVARAIQHGIAIYSSHTAMDVCLQGVSGKMADKIGLRDYRILQSTDEEARIGLGVVGQLSRPMAIDELVAHIKQVMQASYVRYTEGEGKMIKTLALCGGAGVELMDAAIAAGADAYLTADIKYHDFQAADGRITLMDIDHWTSEHYTTEVFAELLEGELPTYVSQKDHSPIKIY